MIDTKHLSLFRLIRSDLNAFSFHSNKRQNQINDVSNSFDCFNLNFIFKLLNFYMLKIAEIKLEYSPLI